MSGGVWFLRSCCGLILESYIVVSGQIRRVYCFVELTLGREWRHRPVQLELALLYQWARLVKGS